MNVILPIGQRASWAQKRTEYDHPDDKSMDKKLAPIKCVCPCCTKGQNK